MEEKKRASKPKAKTTTKAKTPAKDKKAATGAKRVKSTQVKDNGKRNGAPLGNRFWLLRATSGRNRIFETADELKAAAYEYFESVLNNPLKEDTVFHHQGKITRTTVNKMRPFTIKGLCIFLGTNESFFNHFEREMNGKDLENSTPVTKDFCLTLAHIRDCIYTQKLDGTAAGFFNAGIMSKEMGLKEQIENVVIQPNLEENHLTPEQQQAFIDKYL